jgi:hypothetical protein
VDALQSYIVEDDNQMPVHLKHRSPSFTLDNVTAIFKKPLDQICPTSEGRVQWAGAIEFQASIIPGMLADYCDPDELYNSSLPMTHRFRSVYDPEIQRGVKEGKAGPKESLHQAQIDSMMDDIANDRFECPQLMWNLRSGATVWVYVPKKKQLRVYQGVATRPDTNHRHHAIIRFHKKYLQWVETTGSLDMAGYNPNRDYGLLIYTDDFAQEAHRFYVYNYLGSKVPTSAAHYIESKTQAPAIHAKLARHLMENSGVLGTQNVEIMTNQLSRNSAKMLTFGTLTEALRTAFPAVTEDDEFTAVLDYLVHFLDALHNVRPNEIGLLSVAKRQHVRDVSLTDQAMLWHGYFHLANWLRKERRSTWRDDLAILAQPVTYKTFTGDLFDRENPIWQDRALMAPGKRGLRVLNNRQAREAAFDILRTVVSGGPLAAESASPSPSAQAA